MKTLRLSVAGAAGMLLLSLPKGAAAQSTTGFAIDRFEPAERGSQFFVTDNLDLRGAARPAFGAVLDYAYKPLVVNDPNGNERSSVVRHQMFAHLGGSFVLADRLRLGMNLPLALYQDGEETRLNGETLKPADKPAMGDFRFAADLRVVGQKTDPFTLAVGMRAWIPTGERSQFTGDGSVRLAPQVLAAGDLGLLTYAARLAVVYRARDDAYAGSDLGSELVGALGAGIKSKDGKLVIGPEVFGSTVFSGSDTFFAKRSSPAEWVFGLHYDVTDELRVGAGVGGGLTRGYGAPQLRGLLSLEYAAAYEKPDRDKDGIPDDEDACPDASGVRDPDPKKNGCPRELPPPSDRDKDGVLDRDDACPTVPGIRTTDPATNGCPDRDGDGIPDQQDACIDVPGMRTNDPRTNGCPPDKDGDGIPDVDDACPEVKGARSADPKKNGCPADADGDGVIDDVDACPQEAGPPNEDPKKNGCPLVTVTDKEIRIGEQVKFKTGSAEILSESDAVLEAVKKVLEEHPEIAKLRVEGHTDNVGSAYNKALSGRRAAAVMKWLTDHGIDKKRLVSAGYGEEKPVDANDTEEGRANNRRVAFTILERDESKKKPAPVP